MATECRYPIGNARSDPPEALAVAKSLEHYDALAREMDDRARRNACEYRGHVKRLAVAGLAIPWLFLLGALAMVALGGLMTVGTTLRFLGFGLVAAGASLTLMVLRSMFTRAPAMTGRRLSEEEAPALFAEITSVHTQLGAPAPNEVLVVDEFNAAAGRRRAFGFSGRTTDTLILGLPLMDALSPEQFRAVLAHEYGHFKADHSKDCRLAVRALVAWSELLPRLEGSDRYTAKIAAVIGRRYQPHLAISMGALQRSNEFEADAAAVRLCGPAGTASALSAVVTRSSYLGKYWSDIWRCPEGVDAPDGVYGGFPAAMRAGYFEADARRWMMTALRHKATLADSHPGLGERLRAVGSPPVLEPAPALSAAEALLGATRYTLASEFDAAWRAGAAEAWASRYEECVKQWERRRALGTAPGAQEQHEAARLTAELEGSLAAMPLYAAILRTNPEDAVAHYEIGRFLLGDGEATGVEWVSRAMALDPEATAAGNALIADHLWATGEIRGASAHLDRAAEYQSREAEHHRVSAGAALVPHGLAAAQLALLTSHLAGIARLRRAHLARKQSVSGAPDVYVLILSPSPRDMLVVDRVTGIRDDVVRDWPEGLDIAVSVMVRRAGAKRRKLMRAMARVPGSDITPGVALPTVPVDHLFEGLPRPGLELGPNGVSNGDEGHLHVLVEGDAEHFGGLALVEEVDRGPSGTQSAGSGGQHEAPGGGQNRTEG